MSGAAARRSRVGALSYAVRAGCCVGFSSLLPVLCNASAGASRLFAVPLFSPVMVAVTIAPQHLGVSLKNAAAVLGGWSAGACVTSVTLAGAPPSVASTYISLVLLSLAILYPDSYSALAQKMAMTCVLVSLFTAQSTVDAVLPFRVAFSVCAGVLSALAIALLPWPHSRACGDADARLLETEAAAGSLAALLCRSFGEGAHSRGAARALSARAATLRASAGEGEDALRGLQESAQWEELCLLAPRHRFCAELRRRLDVLGELLLACDGAHMALTAIRAAEHHHARAVRRAKVHLLQGGSPSGGDSEIDAGDFDRMDLMLAPAVSALGAAVSDALTAPPARDGEACKVLRGAVETLTTDLESARTAVYYSAATPSFAFASLTSYGPPVEHYALLSSLFRLAEVTLNAKEAACAPMPPPRPLKRQAAELLRNGARYLAVPFTRRPKPLRLLYACKLVSAVVIAAWIGVLTCGSATWAAITAQIVGARSSVHVGSSLRLASARLSGTLFGAMFGYFALAVLGPSSGQRPGSVMALLAVWVALLGVPRLGKRSAYTALVASFVPYIVVLGGAGGSLLGSRQLSYTRIEQNLLGILCFVAVEVIILPQRASALLLARLAATLRAAARSASAAWAPLLASQRCAGCAEKHAKEAAQAQAELRACMARQSALLAEALDEPSWLSPKSKRTLGLLSTLMHSHLGRLETLLSLMHLAADALVPAGGTGLQRPYLACLQSLRPVTGSLHRALHTLFDALADDLVTGANGARIFACAAAVDVSLEALEAAYNLLLIQLRQEHRARVDAAAGDERGVQPPPLAVIMPLDALLFCTRDLVATVDVVAGAVREYQRGGEEDGAGGSVEYCVLGERGTPAAVMELEAEGRAGLCECGAPIALLTD